MIFNVRITSPNTSFKVVVDNNKVVQSTSCAWLIGMTWEKAQKRLSKKNAQITNITRYETKL